MRSEWLKAIENLGVQIMRPLGASAVVAACASEQVLNEIRSHDKVERVDSYVPEVQVSPRFFKNLVGQADEKALGRAAARLARGEVEPPPNRTLSVPNTVVATFLTEADRAHARKLLAREQIRDVHDGGENPACHQPGRRRRSRCSSAKLSRCRAWSASRRRRFRGSATTSHGW